MEKCDIIFQMPNLHHILFFVFAIFLPSIKVLYSANTGYRSQDVGLRHFIFVSFLYATLYFFSLFFFIFGFVVFTFSTKFLAYPPSQMFTKARDIFVQYVKFNFVMYLDIFNGISNFIRKITYSIEKMICNILRL